MFLEALWFWHLLRGCGFHSHPSFLWIFLRTSNEPTMACLSMFDGGQNCRQKLQKLLTNVLYKFARFILVVGNKYMEFTSSMITVNFSWGGEVQKYTCYLMKLTCSWEMFTKNHNFVTLSTNRMRSYLLTMILHQTLSIVWICLKPALHSFLH